MDRLAAMRAFQRVVEAGSFTAVAHEMGVAQPTISKLVAALEAHLGAQLLHRGARGIRLTEAGQDFFESTQRLLAELEAAESRIGHRQAAPSGLLRVTLSAGFGRMHVVPLLPDFVGRYPGVRVDLVVSDRFLDLVEEGLDLAIRIGRLADSSLIARRIGASRRITVASAGYLTRHGTPRHPEELAQHQGIGFLANGAVLPWAFARGGEALSIAPPGWLRTNDAEHVRAAMLAGIGIAHAPSWLFSDLLARGEAVTLLEDWRPEAEPIHAVTPAARRPATRVRVFIDYLAERLAGL
jgi:LysR family transcriptional regulator for bpeEF and oprC